MCVAGGLTVLTPAGLCLHCLDLRHAPLCEDEVSPPHSSVTVTESDPSFPQGFDSYILFLEKKSTFCQQESLLVNNDSLCHDFPLKTRFLISPMSELLILFYLSLTSLASVIWI